MFSKPVTFVPQYWVGYLIVPTKMAMVIYRSFRPWVVKGCDVINLCMPISQ